ncbi:MAG TPA: DUF1559 domain-containing protein [Gemmataceae bacterium]|nr:DUF1559 domain-containing protein [Gemmataceae bacterium]
MLQFECPSCRKLCQAVTEFAGKLVVCPQCGQSVPIPRDAAAITADPPAPPRPVDADDVLRGRSIVKEGDAWWIRFRNGMLVLLGCAVVLTAAALCIMPVGRTRPISARTVSTNNLKQIGLAIHFFHDTHKRLPFNGSDASPPGLKEKYSKEAIGENKQSGSWAFQILPFIEQGPLFAKIDRTHAVHVFLCPIRGRPGVEKSNGGGAWSDYFLNTYINDPMRAADPAAPDMRRKLDDVTDGISFTVIVGQGNIDTRQYTSESDVTGCSNIFRGGTAGTMRAGDNGRTNPTGVTLQRDSAEAPTIGSWGGPFQSGALMCMADASVQMFPYATANFSAFLTPAGGENVAFPQ